MMIFIINFYIISHNIRMNQNLGKIRKCIFLEKMLMFYN